MLAACLPVLVSTVVLVAARFGRRDGRTSLAESLDGFSGGVAVALGYVAGYVALLGPLPWPPISSEERLVWLLPAATLPALLALFALRRSGGERAARRLAGAAFLVLSAFGVAWITEQARRHRFGDGEAVWLVCGATVAAGLLARGGAALARREGESLATVPWCLVATGTALALLFARNAKAAEEAGALASALAAPPLLAAASGRWARRLGRRGAGRTANPGTERDGGVEGGRWRGLADVFALGLVGLLLHGTLFGELAPAAAGLLVVAPLSGWLAEVGPLAPRGGRARAFARLAWVLAPTLAALAVAWSTRPAPSPYADWGG